MVWQTGVIISKRGVHLIQQEESMSLYVFMCASSVVPLVVLSDIWHGDFLACGKAERGKRSVRRQAA